MCAHDRLYLSIDNDDDHIQYDHQQRNNIEDDDDDDDDFLFITIPLDIIDNNGNNDIGIDINNNNENRRPPRTFGEIDMDSELITSLQQHFWQRYSTNSVDQMNDGTKFIHSIAAILLFIIILITFQLLINLYSMFL